MRSQQIHATERCAGEWVADEVTVQDIALNAGLNVLVFKVVNEQFAWQGRWHLSYPVSATTQADRPAWLL